MVDDQRARLKIGKLLAASLEVLIAIALATASIAALQSTAPAAGLGVLYLLAVLAVAIRRGQLAALLCALLSMFVLNFLFITPRHRLAIAHSQDVVELVVLMIAAVVVGRLASLGRDRAAEARSRAALASAREREASLLAEVSSAILAGPSIGSQLESIALRVARTTGASRARLALTPVPSPDTDELAVPLHARLRSAWLYLSRDTAWTREELQRIAEPLGRLIDVALERERVAEQAADTEATRRTGTARTAILHAISHDLRSPLTAITSSASALRSAGISTTDQAELLEVINAEGERLARLVDDLLDLSKIQAGAVEPRSDWCDLHDVVAWSVAHLRLEHPIDFQLGATLPLVHADAAQLDRVFSNLIENAVKFSPPGSPVRITGGTHSGRVTVRVIDQGRGIPARHRAQVFEPFFRERADAGSGSGLGLAICRGFVEANGGKIVLQSGAGLGTSFAVSFPLAVQPVAS